MADDPTGGTTKDRKQGGSKTKTRSKTTEDNTKANTDIPKMKGEDGPDRPTGSEGNREGRGSRPEETERMDRITREKRRARETRPAASETTTVRDRMAGRQKKEFKEQPKPAANEPRATTPNNRGQASGDEVLETKDPKAGRDHKVTTWSTNLLERGNRRNESRLEEADRNDADLIGESLGGVEEGGTTGGRPKWQERGPTKVGTEEWRQDQDFLEHRPEMFFLPPLVGPNDTFDPPNWFMGALTTISGTTTRTPTKPPLRFEMSTEAAEENANELKKMGYDLSRLIEENNKSTLHYGSEFRTVGELEPLLGQHPNFGRLVSVLSHGMPYVFTRELDPLTKLEEMRTLIERGNHKSAQSNPEQVKILLGKDVQHGFVIPIPIETIYLIPNAAVQPLGLVQQWTTKEDGTRAIKYRITQDLSFSSNKEGPNRSINSRVNMKAYAEMVYGWCFPRTLHYIASMRSHHPNQGILICKYDYSDAYRRIAHSASAATQTIAVNGHSAFISLRLTFGGSPNPPTWCMFSEIVTDLANEIALCKEWNPEELRSPAQPLTPKPKRLPDGVPLARCKTLSVLVPETTGGKVDGFIDDLIHVFLDTPENCERQPHVVPLAMHVTSRPHVGDGNEPVPRRPILSLPKLEAEGSPAEVQTVLGCQIDTRRMEVSLPEDKFEAWMADVKTARRNPRTGRKELEQLLGRLNHASYVMPLARHFLTRLREAVGGGRPEGMGAGSRKANRRMVTLSYETRADLKLWEKLLGKARIGVSINLLVTRQPDKIGWSDACPFGIGGYLLSGRAWRVKIPIESPIHGKNGVNNLLEFIGMVVNIWLTCLEPGSDQSCILAIGDNTSAIGWLHHTATINPEGATREAHLIVARKLAKVLLKHNCCLASQHIKGDLNVVADLLSFEGEERGKRHPLAYDNPPNDVLTERFLKYLPSQVTGDFVISQLPIEISSWIMRVLRTVELSLTANKKAATRVTTEYGGGGGATVDTSPTEATYTSINYPSTRRDCLSRHFSVSIERPSGQPLGNLKELVRNRWSRTLSDKPLATWLRRFGSVSGRAPCTSRDQPTCTQSYEGCSERGTTRIHQRPSNEPSPQNSYERCSNERGGGRRSGMATRDVTSEATAEIAIAAYFFAMRSCEITNTPRRGRTKILCVRDITFRDKRGGVLKVNKNYEKLDGATRVTVTFEDQKNGMKMDKRTHQRTGDQVMCPVKSLSSLVRRIMETVPEANGDTQINTVIREGRKLEITGEALRENLRSTCREEGGRDVFGYAADEIGTRSIRSGAAMGLFLTNHSVAKIMILGRWSSDAFLVYIRPQIMEWTNQMSHDMIVNDSFFDASNRREIEPGRAEPSTPTRSRVRENGTNGRRENTGMYIDH